MIQARCWIMISVALILSLFVHNNICHVALTFPPSRNLNLDFLDNVRYEPMESVTSLKTFFQDYSPLWNAKG